MRHFVRGLWAALPRENCWTITKHAGDASLDGMPDLVAGAKWDDEQVRADVRRFVAVHLDDPDAVLMVDETGDLKKGQHTVGVQRQYSNTSAMQPCIRVMLHHVPVLEGRTVWRLGDEEARGGAGYAYNRQS